MIYAHSAWAIGEELTLAYPPVGTEKRIDLDKPGILLDASVGYRKREDPTLVVRFSLKKEFTGSAGLYSPYYYLGEASHHFKPFEDSDIWL